MQVRSIAFSDKSLFQWGLRVKFLDDLLRVKLLHSRSQICKRHLFYKVTIFTCISACLYGWLRNSPRNFIESLVLTNFIIHTAVLTKGKIDLHCLGTAIECHWYCVGGGPSPAIWFAWIYRLHVIIQQEADCMFWVALSNAHKFNQYHYVLEVLKSRKKTPRH